MVTTVPVLQLDPDLGAAVDVSKREAAERACCVADLAIPAGHWDAEGVAAGRDGFGLLILSGLLCRRVVQNEHFGAELMGPGDLLRPWDQIGGWTTIPTESSWTVIEPVRLAILDAAFARRAAAFPEISTALVRRCLLRSRYLTILIAIISQRKVETRLNMLFWHLADRFGQMHGDCVYIPVPLTHSLLGELVAARRPSVTTALSRLHERGILARSRNGWRLSGTVPPAFHALRGSDGAGATDLAPLAAG